MIKNFLDADEDRSPSDLTPTAEGPIFSESHVDHSDAAPELSDPFTLSDIEIERTLNTVQEPTAATEPEPPIEHTEPSVAAPNIANYTPPTQEQSARMSGLALTAGIAFVSSVAFMLCLGWLMDVMMGTSPWGIVGGIVLGSIIGFVQFFRLNSQILNAQSASRPRSLMDLGGEDLSTTVTDDEEVKTEHR